MRVSATPFSSIAQLRAIEKLIEQRPDELRLYFARACCLDDLGRPDEALQAYRGVLERDPKHFGSLTNLGSLYFERGELPMAWLQFQGALASDPEDPMAHLNMGRLYLEQKAYDLARMHFELVIAARKDLQNRLHAYNGLADLYERLGELAKADAYRARAFEHPLVWRFPYTGKGEPLRVLLLASPRGGDVISNLFFDDDEMQRTVMVPESYKPGVVLPEHDLIFNGIGEPDKTRATLERAIALVDASSAPVINHPSLVLRTDREEVMARLEALPSVVTPRTRRLARADISVAGLAAAGYSIPVLLRSPGFHAGFNFVLVGRPQDLPTALASLPGDELYVIRFHDARGADGWVRKYRVVFIDGRPYPIHLALAQQWKVHYFSAAMADYPEHRAEEERFLNDTPGVLGAPAMEALAAIAAELGLDYCGVDFGFDPQGRLIVFEANATMAIYPPSDDPRWEYRRAAINRAIDAARTMIRSRRNAGAKISS